MITTKTVSIMVEFSMDVPYEFTEEEINSITFEIPTAQIVVYADGAPLIGAKVTGYCTQEYFSDPE